MYEGEENSKIVLRLAEKNQKLECFKHQTHMGNWLKRKLRRYLGEILEDSVCQLKKGRL